MMECPLCMDEFDIADQSFKPCPCGYQICRFCWHHILTNLTGQCPACRRPYDKQNVEFTPVSAEEFAKVTAEKRQRQKERKEAQQVSRKHLANVRVVQKNLVYVSGLPAKLANEDVLKTNQFFGKFGRIIKLVVSRRPVNKDAMGCPGSGRESSPDPGIGSSGLLSKMTFPTGSNISIGVYVTYARSEDASEAIAHVDGAICDGRMLRASHGTTKYCSYYLRNMACPNPLCMYLHEHGDETDSYLKEEVGSLMSSKPPTTTGNGIKYFGIKPSQATVQGLLKKGVVKVMPEFMHMAPESSRYGTSPSMDTDLPSTPTRDDYDSPFSNSHHPDAENYIPTSTRNHPSSLEFSNPTEFPSFWDTELEATKGTPPNTTQTNHQKPWSTSNTQTIIKTPPKAIGPSTPIVKKVSPPLEDPPQTFMETSQRTTSSKHHESQPSHPKITIPSAKRKQESQNRRLSGVPTSGPLSEMTRSISELVHSIPETPGFNIPDSFLKSLSPDGDTQGQALGPHDQPVPPNSARTKPSVEAIGPPSAAVPGSARPTSAKYTGSFDPFNEPSFDSPRRATVSNVQRNEPISRTVGFSQPLRSPPGGETFQDAPRSANGERISQQPSLTVNTSEAGSQSRFGFARPSFSPWSSTVFDRSAKPGPPPPPREPESESQHQSGLPPLPVDMLEAVQRPPNREFENFMQRHGGLAFPPGLAPAEQAGSQDGTTSGNTSITDGRQLLYGDAFPSSLLTPTREHFDFGNSSGNGSGLDAGGLKALGIPPAHAFLEPGTRADPYQRDMEKQRLEENKNQQNFSRHNSQLDSAPPGVSLRRFGDMSWPLGEVPLPPPGVDPAMYKEAQRLEPPPGFESKVPVGDFMQSLPPLDDDVTGLRGPPPHLTGNMMHQGPQQMQKGRRGAPGMLSEDSISRGQLPFTNDTASMEPPGLSANALSQQHNPPQGLFSLPPPQQPQHQSQQPYQQQENPFNLSEMNHVLGSFLKEVAAAQEDVKEKAPQTQGQNARVGGPAGFHDPAILSFNNRHWKPTSDANRTTREQDTS